MIFILFLIPMFLVALAIKFISRNKKKSIKGKHVVITGGSSGIGKSVAKLAAEHGAHITIIARNLEKLTEAQKEIETVCISADQKITKISVNVSHYEDVEYNLNELEKNVGPIYMLINCAGMAICGRIEDYTQNDIKTLIDVNFLGTLYPIKAVIPRLKERKEGIIVLTASAVALMGMYGYSVYSSCKFALRGLAESLYMEVKHHGISVTLSLPPDTDTPGYENENKSKPIETKLLSEAAGVYHPDEVAKKLLNDALKGQFFSFIGFESYILTKLCIGMSPFTSFGDVMIESIIIGPLRFISSFYIRHFHKIIYQCYLDKEKATKKTL